MRGKLHNIADNKTSSLKLPPAGLSEVASDGQDELNAL